MSYSLMSSTLKSDDGRRYPKKLNFLGAYYDESKRTFHAWQDWRTQTIDKGIAARYYKIVFAPDFRSLDHGSSNLIEYDDKGEIRTEESIRFNRFFYDAKEARDKAIESFDRLVCEYAIEVL